MSNTFLPPPLLGDSLGRHRIQIVGNSGELWRIYICRDYSRGSYSLPATLGVGKVSTTY
jgi:hypothetical protein